MSSDINGFNVEKLCFDKIPKTHLHNQICIITYEVAMFEALKKCYDVDISAVAGLSLGEYVAMIVASIIDFKTAIDLIYSRYEAIRNNIEYRQAKMYAVCNMGSELLEFVCEQYGKENVSISSYNSLNQQVVSMKTEFAYDFSKTISNCKGKCIPLNIEYP